MKLAYFSAPYNKTIKLPIEFIKQLPKKILFFITKQFINQKLDLIKQLKTKDIVVKTIIKPHNSESGQLLGCNLEIINEDVEALVFIGDGDFHPTALLYYNKLPVYQYNPFSKQSRILTKEFVKKELKRNKAAKAHFLMKKNIGVLISVKTGQNFHKMAFELENAYPNKNFYFLISNEINSANLENFSFIDVFINCACPRIGLNDSSKFPKPVLNLADVQELTKNAKEGSNYPLSVLNKPV